MTPHRPLIRYYGGKWHLAPWIINAMPRHRVYTEVFGGAASVLFRKQKAPIEVLNELDPDVAWLHRNVRHPLFHQILANTAKRMPYAPESLESLRDREGLDIVRRGLRPVVRGAMTRSGAIDRSSGALAGFRTDAGNTSRGSAPSEEWSRWPALIPMFHARMRRVTVLCEPAIDVLRRFDADDAVHYVDPPYVPSARSAARKGYTHDMTEADHVELLGVLRDMRGAVLLSGYDSDLYRDGLPGWRRLERVSVDAGGHRRTESLWLNPAAASRSPATAQRGLFDAAEVAA